MFSCMGLKFDRVSPWADLTNVVVGCSNDNSTSRKKLIGVSPVVLPYTIVLFPYTFGLVGV